MQIFAIRQNSADNRTMPSLQGRLISTLIACLLILLFLPSGKLSAQTVTLTAQRISLKNAFRQIEQQTGYSFLVNTDLLKTAKKVSFDLKEATIKQAMDACMKGQELTYRIKEKIVYIKKKEKKAEPPVNKNIVAYDPSLVHGRVVDSAGNPLEGASIEVRGAQRGRVVAAADGSFDISGLQNGDTLLISYISYKDYQLVYKGPDNYLYIRMAESQNLLDATQVQAYGTTTRRFSTGDISTVTAEDIAKQPVSNIALALQGRVPGLLVTPQGGGSPGARVTLQVRGQNTLGSTASTLVDDEPLIIVDGIPTALQNNNMVQQLNSFIAGSGLSPLNYINPADVQSISVLKDADATAIYGSQGANGVIVITTKRGTAGKTRMNLNVQTGPNAPTDNLHMMNTGQYLTLRKKAIQTDGIEMDKLLDYQKDYFEDLLHFDSSKYTDWVNKFFNNNPTNTDLHLSLSGGSGSDSYILSGGYTHSAYNLPGDYADNRFSLHSGAHHSSLNHKFSIDFAADVSYDKNNTSAVTSAGQAMVLPPNYPDMFTPSGDLAWDYNGRPLTQQLFADLKRPYSMEAFNLGTSLNINYEILPGLKMGILAGYSRTDNKEYGANPKAAQDPHGTSFNISADFANSVAQSINIEPQLNYRKYIGNGILTALIGGTYKKSFSSQNEQTGYNYSDDAFIHSIEGAQQIYAYDDNQVYKYVGGFARLNYTYASKYILNLTGRRDGSSNFGPNQQFGNFGSVGVGWIFSEESAFKKLLPFISFGKLSGNYGTNGSDGVAAYQYQSFYKIYANNSIQFQGIVPLVPNNLYNPYYTWASKHALNIHMDLGFLQDRVLLGASWYQNRTGNQLTSYPLPNLTGFTSVVENMDASVQDRGIELTLTTKNIKRPHFQWNSTFNFTMNRSKLLAFPNLEKSAYYGTYEVGKPLSFVYGFKFAGLNDTTGLFQYYKADGTITSKGLSFTKVARGGDFMPIGNSEPDFYGGFGNDFTYKGLSLSIFFEFKKRFAKNYMAALYSTGGPGSERNYPVSILDQIWSGPGDAGAVLQRPSTYTSIGTNGGDAYYGGYYFSTSSGAYSDVFYARLKTLALSYQLPEKWVKAMHMQNFSVFVNAQNVLTFTNYEFGDPEYPGQLYGLPTQRIISCGLNLGL